jgi:hypothetical protein
MDDTPNNVVEKPLTLILSHVTTALFLDISGERNGFALMIYSDQS